VQAWASRWRQPGPALRPRWLLPGAQPAPGEIRPRRPAPYSQHPDRAGGCWHRKEPPKVVRVRDLPPHLALPLFPTALPKLRPQTRVQAPLQPATLVKPRAKVAQRLPRGSPALAAMQAKDSLAPGQKQKQTPTLPPARRKILAGCPAASAASQNHPPARAPAECRSPDRGRSVVSRRLRAGNPDCGNDARRRPDGTCHRCRPGITHAARALVITRTRIPVVGSFRQSAHPLLTRHYVRFENLPDASRHYQEVSWLSQVLPRAAVSRTFRRTGSLRHFHSRNTGNARNASRYRIGGNVPLQITSSCRRPPWRIRNIPQT